MRSLRLATHALVGVAVLTACGEQTQPTVTSTEHPSLSVGNAPSTSGLFVVRDEGNFLLIVGDAQAGLAAAMNGRDGFAVCGENTTILRAADYQTILSPSDQSIVQQLFQTKDAFVNVYAWDGVWPDDICDLLTSARLAQGTAQLIYTDNDTYGSGETNRGNGYGFSAHGVVTLTGGGLANFNAVDRTVALWSQPDVHFRETTNISLIPIP